MGSFCSRLDNFDNSDASDFRKEASGVNISSFSVIRLLSSGGIGKVLLVLKKD